MNKHVLMQGAGEGGAGGGGGAGAGAGAPGAGAGAGEKPWYDTFQDATVKEWVKNYGQAYPSAESMAVKAFNLEKLLGADKANRAVVLPKSDAKPEEWLAFWRKSGASEKAEDYKLPEAIAKDEGAIKLRDAAMKMGMPVSQFVGFINELQSLTTGAEDKQMAEFEAKAEQEMTALQAEWGKKFDVNVELGRRAAAAFIPHKDKDELAVILQRIEGAIGTGATMKLWANIGTAIGEHGFVAGDLPVPDGGMTPNQARIEINALINDKEFGKKLAAGDADSKARWDKLHKIAASDQGAAI